MIAFIHKMKEGVRMKYQFSFYTEADYEELLGLAINSYEWEYPAVGLSRIEFAKGLHPEFTGNKKAWQHTVGLYRENGKLAACVWNEGNYDGEVFFLYDSKERAEDEELTKHMLNFARMYAINIGEDDSRNISLDLFIPQWNTTLMRLAKTIGMKKSGWADHYLVLPFEGKKLEVKLPKGYTIIDGNTAPAFYLSNVHRVSFGYGANDRACDHGAAAFEELRTMRDYDKDFELCILDPMGIPVAMAIVWYNPNIPYCELEPLGVVWWERRKGLGTAILHEAANRVMAKYPHCKGMKGGDQKFYTSIGYEEKSEIWPYHWETKVYISWEEESKDQDFTSVMKW